MAEATIRPVPVSRFNEIDALRPPGHPARVPIRRLARSAIFEPVEESANPPNIELARRNAGEREGTGVALLTTWIE